MSQPPQKRGIAAEGQEQPGGADQIEDVVHGSSLENQGAQP